MKKPAKLIISMVTALFAMQSSMLAQEAATPECSVVISHLEKEIAKDPSRLLLVVEDAITLNEKCACEIVHTAITVSGADSEMVGRIVSTAVKAAPTAASTIAECALAASPKSAAAVKAAMAEAVGQGDTGGSGKEPVSTGKEPVLSGKEPLAGKEPVAVAPVKAPEDPDSRGDFYGGSVDLHGIYLFVPGTGPRTTVVEKEVVKIIKKCVCEKKKIHPRPATKS